MTKNPNKNRLAFAAILLLGLVLAACGPTPTTGVLRLLVNGLPNGTPADIRVIAPDKSEKIVNASQDVTLLAGKYFVTGAAVRSQQAEQTGYASDVNNLEFEVTAGRTKILNLNYTALTTKISPLARISNTESNGSLVSNTLGADNRTTLVYSSSNPQLAGLKVGDIFTIGVTTQTPNGHMGKVVSITGTTIVTEPVPLEEAIEEGAFFVEKELDPNAKDVILPQGFSRSINPGCLKVKLPISISGSPNNNLEVGGTITIAGQLCMGIKFNLSGSISKKLRTNVHFTVNKTISTKFDISGTLSATLSKEIEVVSLNFSPITFFVGPLPVVMVPKLALIVGASGTVTAGVEFGIEAGAEMTGGFSYNGDTKRFTPISSVKDSFTAPYPKPTASMELRVFVAPEASLMFYGVVGPFARVVPFIRFQVNFLPNLNWGLFAGVTFTAGIRAGFVTFGISASIDLYTFEFKLLDSTTPPPIGIPISSFRGFNASFVMTYGSNNVLYIGNGNKLKALNLSSSTTEAWSFTATDTITAMVRGNNNSVYLADFSGTIYKLDNTGAELWRTPTALGALEVRQMALSPSGVLVTSGGSSVRTFNSSTGEAGWSDTPVANESLYGVGIDKTGNVWVNGSAKLFKYSATGTPISSINAPSSPGNLAIDSSGTVFVRDNVGVRAVNNNVTFKWTNLNNNRAVLVSGNSDAASSAAIGPDGTIYVCTTPPDAGLTAINPNGTIKWVSRYSSVCETTPTVGSDGKVYITTSTDVRAYNPNGTLAWSQAIVASSNAPSLLFDNQQRLVSGEANGISFLNAKSDLASGMWTREGGDASSSGVAK
jgi:hypothetical protein